MSITLLAVMVEAGSSSRTKVVNLMELPRSCSNSAHDTYEVTSLLAQNIKIRGEP